MYFILFSKTRFTLSCFVTEFLLSLQKGDTKTPRMILISELVRRQEDKKTYVIAPVFKNNIGRLENDFLQLKYKKNTYI